jgi:hypothetical protein
MTAPPMTAAAATAAAARAARSGHVLDFAALGLCLAVEAAVIWGAAAVLAVLGTPTWVGAAIGVVLAIVLAPFLAVAWFHFIGRNYRG